MPLVESRSGNLDTRSVEARMEQQEYEQKKLKNLFPKLPLPMDRGKKSESINGSKEFEL